MRSRKSNVNDISYELTLDKNKSITNHFYRLIQLVLIAYIHQNKSIESITKIIIFCAKNYFSNNNIP